MKTALLTLVLAIGLNAWANEPTAAAPTENQAAPAGTKMSHKDAKEACKKEGHKGKELKDCIKHKQG